MSELRLIEEAEDVTDDVLRDAESVWDGWFADSKRIDWEAFIDRLADQGNYAAEPYDFEMYWSPAVRKIQKHVRALTVS